MSKKFNLLLLHKPSDVHPRSWICVSGCKLLSITRKLENSIKTEKNICREEIARHVANKFNFSHPSVKLLLQGKKKFYPIPIILELTKLCKNGKTYLKEISNNIEYFKVNSASSKPVKALKRLNLDLAKIIGAFMADGNLTYQVIVAAKTVERLFKIIKILEKMEIHFTKGYSKSRKEYYISFFLNYDNFKQGNHLIKTLRKSYQIQTHIKIELMDAHLKNVEAFNKWMRKCFDINPTNFHKRQNAWRSVFSNKIIARYFICFFNIKSGYKADKAFEPKIIKSSAFNIRKAFARGVLMFDGCAKIGGIISFETKSFNLSKSIADIFKKDNIFFSQKLGNDKFIIKTVKKNKPSKLFFYFEKNTDKWFRLKESYGKSMDVEGYQYRYRPQPLSKVTIAELVKILNEVKSCDVEFLINRFNCKHTTIINYLKILKNNKQIRLSRSPKVFNPKYIDENATVLLKKQFHTLLFSNIKKKYIEYKEFTNYMNIENGTLSAWKVRKNRIPLKILKTMCSLVDLDPLKIYENIKQTNRMIAEPN